MSRVVLETNVKMMTSGELDQACNSVTLERTQEATALSCEQFDKNGEGKLPLLSNENGFLGVVDGSHDKYPVGSTSNSKLSNENTIENAELANALLSLGGKHSISDREHNLKNIDVYSKHGCNSSNISQQVSSQSSISFGNNNTWVGNSAALIGYPFTYGLNHLSHCSCTPRAYPSPEWHALQQQIRAQEFPPIGSQAIKQKHYFPSQYQQPWFLASNAFQANFPNFTPMQSINKVSSAIQQKQQHIPQVGIDQAQQIYAQNALKMSTEIPQQMPLGKQDKANSSSVALVAPMILEFNQNNHVPGIPLIYNVNQWLNMPSCEYATSTSGSQTLNHGHKTQILANKISEQCGEKDEGLTRISALSSSANGDPISQLGEAANLILFNSRNCTGKRAADMEQKDSVTCNNFDDNVNSQLTCAEMQLDSSLQQLAEVYKQSQQALAKNQKLPSKSASKNLKNRTCCYCQRVFARPFTLKSHMRRHTKEKPFTCQICHRSFSQSATLENHKLTHSGAKPHQCDTCLKRFAHQTSLKTHLRIHSGEQPYQCNYCQRRFSDGSTLQKHKRTHNGERPFRCLFCEKCFSQSGNMRRHMASTHKTALLAQQGHSEIKTIK